MRNVANNLNDNGLYIFDIFNLDYLLHKDHITRLTIDLLAQSSDGLLRYTQFSTINPEGVLASYTFSSVQKGLSGPQFKTHSQTLQVYSAKQLKEMLKRNGFRVLRITGIDGSKFIKHKTERMLIVAGKK